jgi:mannose-6-phosphate isomerase
MDRDQKSLYAKALEAPVPLLSNTYLHFYNGGKLRAEFMGEPAPRDDFRSEEWIFSTNRAITPGRDNPPQKGFSIAQLPDGSTALLKGLLDAFPEECLGKEHQKRYGTELGVLLKIFDVGEGAHIPVHWHPSPEFSRKHLQSNYGKNECWLVIGTRPGAKAWVGWKEDVGEARFREWMEAQDVEAMRAHLHEIEPRVGDIVFLRDGYVHSLGSGLCVLEPQEPSDWNILAEWKGYPYGREDAHCGLGWDLALQAARFDAMPRPYLDDYVRRRPVVRRREDGSFEEDVLPEEARPFFWITKVTVAPGGKIEGARGRGFHCLTGFKGQGELRGGFGARPFGRGKSYFIARSLPGYTIASTGSEPLEVYCTFPPHAPRGEN